MIKSFNEILETVNNPKMVKKYIRIEDMPNHIKPISLLPPKLIVEDQTDDDNNLETLKKTGFFGTRGAGIIIVSNETKRILLSKRSPWVQEPNTWGVWGGAVNGDEDAYTAATREFREETDYHGSLTNKGLLFKFTKKEFEYSTFLVFVDNEFIPQLDWETSEAKWFKYGDWPKPLHFGLRDMLKDKQAKNQLLLATES